jgi:hypothetical protein
MTCRSAPDHHFFTGIEATVAAWTDLFQPADHLKESPEFSSCQAALAG